MREPISDWQILTGSMLGVWLVLLIVAVVARGSARWRRIVRQTTLALASVIGCMLALELAFRYVFVSSDGFGHTLTARRWLEKHWRPINDLGYRDRQLPTEVGAADKLIAVVGDSFVAAQGVNDIRQRFAGVLQQQLGDDWHVRTIAECGWSTPDQLAGLKKYPLVPRHVVLSYYLNDIEAAARRCGSTCPTLATVDDPTVHWLVNTSHLASFCYWRLFRFGSSKQMGDAYWKYLEHNYNDSKIWAVHEEELRSFVSHVRSQRAGMTVVLFPALFAMERSRPYTKRVAGVFRELGVEVIEVDALATGKQAHELVVNRFDAHPSIWLHKAVGERLADSIRRIDLADQRPDKTTSR